MKPFQYVIVAVLAIMAIAIGVGLASYDSEVAKTSKVRTQGQGVEYQQNIRAIKLAVHKMEEIVTVAEESKVIFSAQEKERMSESILKNVVSAQNSYYKNDRNQFIQRIKDLRNRVRMLPTK